MATRRRYASMCTVHGNHGNPCLSNRKISSELTPVSIVTTLTTEGYTSKISRMSGSSFSTGILVSIWDWISWMLRRSIRLTTRNQGQCSVLWQGSSPTQRSCGKQGTQGSSPAKDPVANSGPKGHPHPKILWQTGDPRVISPPKDFFHNIASSSQRRCHFFLEKVKSEPRLPMFRHGPPWKNSESRNQRQTLWGFLLRVPRAVWRNNIFDPLISDCTEKNVLQWSITRPNQEVLAQTMSFWHLWAICVQSDMLENTQNLKDCFLG